MFDSIVGHFRLFIRRGVFVAAAMATLTSLGGCSSVPDAANPVEWYKGTKNWILGDDEKKTASADAAKPSPGADKAFPTLNSVPDRPVETTAADRKQMATSLTADRDAARYTDEQIRRQTSDVAADTRSGASVRVSPAPAPAPSAVPMPEPSQLTAAVPVPVPTAPVQNSRRGPAVTNQTASVSPAPQRVTQLPQVASVPQAAAPIPQVSAAPPPPPTISPVIAAGQPIPVAPPPGYGQAPLPGAEMAMPQYTGLPPNVRVTRTQQRTASVAADRFSPRFPRGASAIEGPLTQPWPAQVESVLPPELDVSPSAGFAPGAVIPPSAGLTPSAMPPVGGQPVATVRFGNGSSRIGSQGRQQIRQAYQAAQAHVGRIYIVGHASSRTRNMNRTRHEMANFRISYDRARAVARELIRMGVDPGRIVVSAVSDQQPAFIEVMPAGEAGNRRAEIIFAN